MLPRSRQLFKLYLHIVLTDYLWFPVVWLTCKLRIWSILLNEYRFYNEVYLICVFLVGFINSKQNKPLGPDSPQQNKYWVHKLRLDKRDKKKMNLMLKKYLLYTVICQIVGCWIVVRLWAAGETGPVNTYYIAIQLKRHLQC